MAIKQSIDKRLGVLIPTCRDSVNDVNIGLTLTSLLMQSVLPANVYILDEGKIELFRYHGTRMLWNLFSHKGINTSYMHSNARKGVAYARKLLFEKLQDEQLVLLLDDDMILTSMAIENLINVIDQDSSTGFVQGQKIESDPNRSYDNDINQLRGQEGLPNDPFPIYFGDAALLLISRKAVSAINWDIVTKYCIEGLPGEDIAMTLMIVEKFPCYGVPSSKGWHISPSHERWSWERCSDLLQIEQLKTIISIDTLQKAFPHLKELIK